MHGARSRDTVLLNVAGPRGPARARARAKAISNVFQELELTTRGTLLERASSVELLGTERQTAVACWPSRRLTG